MNKPAALLDFSTADAVSFAAALPAGSPPSAGTVSPYDVAHALRATVHQDGTDGAKFLYETFEILNRTLFAGELPPATLLWTAPGSPRAYADHIAADEHGIRFRIRVSPSIVKYGATFVIDVVLHEMVHAACSHLDGDAEPGYKGHGPKFAARCNAIGALLGLAEASAKGRGGKPDCAAWPLNVRPLGYYGENDPRVAKAKGKEKDAGEGRDRGDGPAEREPSREARREAAMRKAMALIKEGRLEEAWAALDTALTDMRR